MACYFIIAAAMTAKEKLEAFLTEISYKPYSHFQVLPVCDPHSGLPNSELAVVLYSRVSDVGEPAHKIFVVASVSILEDDIVRATDEQPLVELVLQLIRQAEEHEIREWLKFRGRHVLEPHPPVGPTAPPHHIG